MEASCPSLPVALAAWMSRRLLDTLAPPLAATRLYGLTIIDVADLDPERMAVRAASIDPAVERSAARPADRPDAIAAAARRWLLPAPARSQQPLRPRTFAARRPALVVGVVGEDGLGVVVRFEHAADTVIVGDARRAAGLLLPAVRRWQAYDRPAGRDAA